ncbi:MAG: ferrous iron transport protein B [Candidatus Eremiobacteraeota bacterium]|nr:ferrous iron transport protein B [Candidatus Eremiobacteraeota bacterium]
MSFIKQKKKSEEQIKNIILIGNPNVGKSVIFGILTGQYVVVSNYPGTTVEISRGNAGFHGNKYQVIDTPGIANLLPMSTDEVVTRDILFEEKDSVIIQVADSKNLARTLLITLQLAEMKIPFILVMNMMDEARERRINIDFKKLSKMLGTQVFPTVAISRTGTDKILPAIEKADVSTYEFKYDPFIEDAVKKIEGYLPDFPISKRSVAIMLLSEDMSLNKWLDEKLTPQGREEIQGIIRDTRKRYPDPLEIVINKERLQNTDRLIKEVAVIEKAPRKGFMYNAGRICMHPVWGVPILIAVLTLMYFFVGKFAAGTVVDFFMGTVFGNAVEGTGIINPFIARVLESIIPIKFVQDLLVGEYGLISVGITYAIAIVLPIVAAFFFFFGILEDSGYLPRLAIIANRVCKWAGLNGKAVLPLILGLGCGAMATISARILDSPKERMLVILLLALGVPCSAQLGLIMGMLAGLKSYAFFIWLFIVLGSMILVGFIANKLIPGETSDFILEIPPLRFPSLKNIAVKTLARIEWYLREAVPIFLLATLFLFFIDKVGILQIIRDMAAPVMAKILSLPPEVTDSFMMGFLRRDYGAAGLLEMARKGMLSNNQILVSMVTITLFLPCVAQMFVIIKEKGLKTAVAVAAFVFTFAFIVGGLLNFALNALGVVL